MYFRHLSQSHDYRSKVSPFMELSLGMRVLIVFFAVFLVLLGAGLLFPAFMGDGNWAAVAIGLILLIITLRGMRRVWRQPLRLYPNSLTVCRFLLPDAEVRFVDVAHFETHLKKQTHRDESGRKVAEDTIAEYLVPVYRDGKKRLRHAFMLPHPAGGNAAFLTALAQDSGHEVRAIQGLQKRKWFERIIG